MNRSIITLTLLVLLSLACGLQTAAPTRNRSESTVYKTTAETQEVSTFVRMVVVADEGLNIRADHTEESADVGDLFPGDKVTCEFPLTVVGDSVWCKHELGWSNARWLMFAEGAK